MAGVKYIEIRGHNIEVKRRWLEAKGEVGFGPYCRQGARKPCEVGQLAPGDTEYENV